MIAKFPNDCCVCGQAFVPGEDEIEQHPTMRGPKGGKKYMHVHCDGGASHDLPPPPSHQEYLDQLPYGPLQNPFTNAGRRTRKGKQKAGRLPRMAASASCDVGGMSKEDLVDLVEAKGKDSAAAAAELSRRGRNAEGTKLAWLQDKMKAKKKAANNPFGRGYGYSF
jgi:hypothetical protein